MPRTPVFTLLAMIGCSTEYPLTLPAEEAPTAEEIQPEAQDLVHIVVVGKDGHRLGESMELPEGPSGRGIPQLRRMHHLNGAVYAVPRDIDAEALVRVLRASGDYEYVEIDAIHSVQSNDPYRARQWNLDRVDAEGAWAYATGAGVVVAVIDTGVSEHGPDGINAFAAGYDFVNDDSDPWDDYGHGTHVAGTIAQRTDNGVGVAGLAPGATILPIKVCDGGGSCTTSDIVDGIHFAVLSGADVINMSLGGSGFSDLMGAAVATARDAGVLVVCSAGNDYGGPVLYPAAYEGALAVGATSWLDRRADYSNVGPELFLAAPGSGVLQETTSGGSWLYASYDGTSMAAPHVAASAALLLSAGASPDDVERLLAQTALDMGPYGWDRAFGHGLVQPAAALAAWTAEQLSVVPLHGDLDGDGAQDLVTWNPVTGLFSAINAAGDAILPGVELGGQGDQPVLGDFDGDGRDDLAVWSPDTATWSGVDVDGQLLFSELHQGADGDVMMAADLDGDGDDDLVSWHPDNGAWSGKRVEGDVIFLEVAFGSPADLPMVLDLDGDGAAELGLYSPSTGKWGAIDQTGAVVLDRSIGQGGEQPVAGDVNHNGAEDFGTWRSSTGKWTVKAANNQVLVRNVALGAPDASPMLADVNGDGMDDLVVFQPATGLWSAMSASGVLLFTDL